MNKKPKALGRGVKKKKQTKGKGLYMNKKPKALGKGVGENVFKKTLEQLKKKKVRYF